MAGADRSGGRSLRRARRDTLYIQYHNHVAQARRLAEAEIEWGGQSAIGGAIAELERRGARRDRVGVIGPMGFRAHAGARAKTSAR